MGQHLRLRRLVCVFYDRSELCHAKAVAAVIEAEGLVTWIADRDALHDWRHDITGILGGSDCLGAVVIWSEAAARNPIVIGEADATIRAGRRLLNLLLADVHPPLGLESVPRVLLRDWDGSIDNPVLKPVRERIVRMAASATNPNTRIDEIVLEGRTLQCPAFVFSVSSFETQISPAKTLELLNLFTFPAILVSAYDVLGTRDPSPDVTPGADVLRDLEQKDTVIFLDSGNYEAYRFGDMFWQRSPWVLHEATSRLRCDVIFCHDRIIEMERISDRKPAQIAQQILVDLDRDAKTTNRQAICPIIHAPRLGDGTFNSKLLPELCALIAKKRTFPLVAVAERELGDGILERARRVRSIRRALDRVRPKQPLHILGTGNPLSMLILTLAGGNVFDGLEWCRTVIDAETMRLHHFHHFDLFLDQRSRIRDEILRGYLATQDELLTAKAKAVLHNLYFFGQFADELRQAQQQDNFEGIFERYLPGQYGRNCSPPCRAQRVCITAWPARAARRAASAVRPCRRPVAITVAAAA